MSSKQFSFFETDEIKDLFPIDYEFEGYYYFKDKRPDIVDFYVKRFVNRGDYEFISSVEYTPNMIKSILHNAYIINRIFKMQENTDLIRALLKFNNLRNLRAENEQIFKKFSNRLDIVSTIPALSMISNFSFSKFIEEVCPTLELNINSGFRLLALPLDSFDFSKALLFPEHTIGQIDENLLLEHLKKYMNPTLERPDYYKNSIFNKGLKIEDILIEFDNFKHFMSSESIGNLESHLVFIMDNLDDFRRKNFYFGLPEENFSLIQILLAYPYLQAIDSKKIRLAKELVLNDEVTTLNNVKSVKRVLYPSFHCSDMEESMYTVLFNKWSDEYKNCTLIYVSDILVGVLKDYGETSFIGIQNIMSPDGSFPIIEGGSYDLPSTIRDKASFSEDYIKGYRVLNLDSLNTLPLRFYFCNEHKKRRKNMKKMKEQLNREGIPFRL